MTATYQELLKKAYIQRLRNQKDGNALLACLDSIFEDYLEEVNDSSLRYDYNSVDFDGFSYSFRNN